MNVEPNGELVPLGGGDSIPLVRETLSVGRRESCDITLNFPNVSGLHCELTFKEGRWNLRDLNSTNGVRVNGHKVNKRVLHPGDQISIAKRKYIIQYNPIINHSVAEALEDIEEFEDVPLLEKAGLIRRSRENGPNSRRSTNGDK